MIGSGLANFVRMQVADREASVSRQGVSLLDTATRATAGAIFRTNPSMCQ